MKLATTIAGLTLAVAAAYSLPTSAQDLHSSVSQPVARCQSALPVFDTLIRKRPLAVQNEGSTPSFITCGFEFDAGEAVDYAPLMVDTYFSNNTTADVELTCSGVTGFAGGVNEYVAFTVVVPAEPETPEDGNIFWEDADFEGGGMLTSLFAMSCNLPAGVGINDTYIYWESAGSPPV